MYVRWAEAKGMKVELIAESPGEEAGIRSVTYRINGPNAYGWLKTESGVHRLVRISPFDSAARRHTSFSSVWVYPVVDDAIEIEVQPNDIRIDTYRSSGAGGQHVNTTDSAVRITHLPTGIVVTSSEKSQHQNRANAMAALKSRLYEMELRRRNEAITAQHEAKGDAGWGNQIRSYVLQPYQMVKDLRTGVETSDTSGVLDGDLDAFMAAALALQVGARAGPRRRLAPEHGRRPRFGGALGRGATGSPIRRRWSPATSARRCAPARPGCGRSGRPGAAPSPRSARRSRWRWSCARCRPRPAPWWRAGP